MRKLKEAVIVLGLKCYSHDTGAAIISDESGELRTHAISEARLNRRKHSFTYPLMAIDYCLKAMNLRSLDDIDLICFDRHMESWPEPGSQFGYSNALRRHHPRYDDNHRWNYLVEQSLKLDKAKVRWINHIDAHAASAYYVSPFDDAAILIAEGGTGIYHGTGTDLNIVDRIGYLSDTYRDGEKLPKRRDHFVNSSFFYDKVSENLGYDIFGAGQTMALAGYGHLFEAENSFSVDPDRFDDFIINHDKTIHGMTNAPVYDGDDSEKLVGNPWVSLARQAQDTLEEDVLYLAWLAKKKTHAKKICLAGGAALNCIINRKIIESGPFLDVYIQPAASDEGIPLGCALSGYYTGGGELRREMNDAYLGWPNDPGNLKDVAGKWQLSAKPASPKEVAEMLAAGKIIGRVAGGSEYGPRALGNRSILADPRPQEMKNKLNTQIKHREGFRPFAPSCLEDRPPPFFNSPRRSPFMVIAGSAHQSDREKVPAVTHADGTCRIQTVSRDQNADYYELIEAFGDLTDCYVLVNTSFNDREEPIVETYDDAASCFLRTGLDALYMDGVLMEKTNETPVLTPTDNNATTAARVEQVYSDLIEHYCDVDVYVNLATRLNEEESHSG